MPHARQGYPTWHHSRPRSFLATGFDSVVGVMVLSLRTINARDTSPAANHPVKMRAFLTHAPSWLPVQATTVRGRPKIEDSRRNDRPGRELGEHDHGCDQGSGSQVAWATSTSGRDPRTSDPARNTRCDQDGRCPAVAVSGDLVQGCVGLALACSSASEGNHSWLGDGGAHERALGALITPSG